jgi:hypothetical protein
MVTTMSLRYRFLDEGMPFASSAAFRFAPNPKMTFVRSLGTGVPSTGDGAASTIDEILEKPGLGAGAGLPLLGGTETVAAPSI